MRLTLYDQLESGNGYKVRLLMAQRGLAFTRIEMDIVGGATRTPEYLAINANAKIPLLDLGDGRRLAESNAIMLYLAEGTAFLPADAFQRAKVTEWLFFEQYSHEPYIAVRRNVLHHTPEAERDAGRMAALEEGGYKALTVMEKRLSAHAYLVNDAYTIADIALYAYSHVAGEGGFDLGRFPGITAWIERVRGQPNHIPITQG